MIDAPENEFARRHGAHIISMESGGASQMFHWRLSLRLIHFTPARHVSFDSNVALTKKMHIHCSCILGS